MKSVFCKALALSAVFIATQAVAQVTLYEGANFAGRSFTTQDRVPNLERFGYNDRAGSVVVSGERGEVCDETRFNGRCVILRQGRYPSLAAIGMDYRISSVRVLRSDERVDDNRYAPVQPVGQATFYERDNFSGRTFTTQQRIGNFESTGFNNRVSSIEVVGTPWQVCEDRDYGGRCMILQPGRYPSLTAIGMNNSISSAFDVQVQAQAQAPTVLAPMPQGSSVTLYEQERFGGRSFTAQQRFDNIGSVGYRGRAASAEVVGAPWQVCDDVQYRGHCMILPPGRYPFLASMGMGSSIASGFDVGNGARSGEQDRRPVALYDGRRRDNERLYEVPVTSVRAVVGPPEQRCWIEREQVSQDQRRNSVPGALAGAVIGGILGHQVGGGSGNTIATVGGMIAGGAIGANIGGRIGGSSQPAMQDVQRCTGNPGQVRADLWDVTYSFNGQEHRAQMTMDPGSTVIVNQQGEPRNPS